MIVPVKLQAIGKDWEWAQCTLIMCKSLVTDLFLVFSTKAVLYRLEHGGKDFTQMTSKRITCHCRQYGQRTRVHWRSDKLKGKRLFDENNASISLKTKSKFNKELFRPSCSFMDKFGWQNDTSISMGKRIEQLLEFCQNASEVISEFHDCTI